MEENLISKKDLLGLTGISYGQLYRWKRKNLIPEEWFIKKSSFTGQETFFPKDRVLERINQILDLKEGASLDDLAAQFSVNPIKGTFSREVILSKDLTTEHILSIYETMFCYNEAYNFTEALILFIFSEILKRGNASNIEIKPLIKMLKNYETLEPTNTILFCRKLGVSSWFLINGNLLTAEEDLKVIEIISLSEYIEKVNLILK